MTQPNSMIPASNAEIVRDDKYDHAKKEQFLSYIHRQPKDNEIKVNQFANKSKYLPISYIEMTLDELFFMEWTTENFQYQVVANELIGSLDLVFTHPVTGRRIRRVASVPVASIPTRIIRRSSRSLALGRTNGR